MANIITTMKNYFKNILHNGANDNPNQIFINDEMPYINALALNISTVCQRQCERCFGHLDDYVGNVFMDLSTAKKATEIAIDMLKKTDPCHIIIYGGEPLLNWKMLREYIPWIKKNTNNRSSLSTNTNGISLTYEIIDFHLDHETNFNISLDGPFSFHSGKVTKSEFDHIIKMIQFGVKKNRDHMSIQCVIKKRDIPQLNEILSFIISLGVKNINLAKDMREFWDNSDRNNLAKQMKDIISTFDGIIRPCMEGTFDCISCKSSGLMVYPNGDAYDACYNFACTLASHKEFNSLRKEEFYLGNIFSGISLTPELTKAKKYVKENLKCYLLREDLRESVNLIYGSERNDLFFPIRDFIKY